MEAVFKKLSTGISAFHVDFFKADIQIPKTQLQALLPFPTPESLRTQYSPFELLGPAC